MRKTISEAIRGQHWLPPLFSHPKSCEDGLVCLHRAVMGGRLSARSRARVRPGCGQVFTCSAAGFSCVPETDRGKRFRLVPPEKTRILKSVEHKKQQKTEFVQSTQNKQGEFVKTFELTAF